MQICEEYLQRHSIGVPLFRHLSLGYLFFRQPSDLGFKWMVLSIIWRDPDHRPGRYIFRFSQPLHDSHSFEMDSLQPDAHVNWDDYEDYLCNWAARRKKEYVICNRKEVVLTAWEMFCYSHDRYLSKHYHHLSSLIYGSLNFASPIEARYSKYQDFMAYVDLSNNPFRAWRENIHLYSRHYCHWLADLIKSND